ncbi:MAG: hypothetical protein NZM29_01285 [Nitrospira sp.]|nr:hypothetical protein [Nitrospira sp.]
MDSRDQQALIAAHVGSVIPSIKFGDIAMFSMQHGDRTRDNRTILRLKTPRPVADIVQAMNAEPVATGGVTVYRRANNPAPMVLATHDYVLDLGDNILAVIQNSSDDVVKRFVDHLKTDGNHRFSADLADALKAVSGYPVIESEPAVDGLNTHLPRCKLMVYGVGINDSGEKEMLRVEIADRDVHSVPLHPDERRTSCKRGRFVADWGKGKLRFALYIVKS